MGNGTSSESKLTSPPLAPPSSEAPTGSKVRFSPELVQQLHQDQERARFERYKNALPQSQVSSFAEHPERVQEERREREKEIAEMRHALEAANRVREEAKRSEDEIVKRARSAADKMSRRAANEVGARGENTCQQLGAAVAELLGRGDVGTAEVDRALREYEKCVRAR